MSILTAQFPIIGHIRSPLSQKFGIPRQPNLVAIPCQLEMIPPFDIPQAFAGLQNFSHLWILWQFHQNRMQNKTKFRPQVRPPRLGGNDSIGVFASRSMYRPSNIGLSVVELLDIKKDNGVVLYLRGGDMLDGTPVLDIKPYIGYSDSISHAKSSFAQQEPLQKQVIISKIAEQNFTNLMAQNWLNQQDMDLICQLIAQDPRPAYKQKIADRLFIMRYKQFDIAFVQSQQNQLEIKDIQIVA